MLGTALNSHVVFLRRKNNNGTISEKFLIIKFTSVNKTKVTIKCTYPLDKYKH